MNQLPDNIQRYIDLMNDTNNHHYIRDQYQGLLESIIKDIQKSVEAYKKGKYENRSTNRHPLGR